MAVNNKPQNGRTPIAPSQGSLYRTGRTPIAPVQQKTFEAAMHSQAIVISKLADAISGLVETQTPGFYTFAEVAEMLRCPISEVRGLCNDARIGYTVPYRRRPGRILKRDITKLEETILSRYKQ